MRHREAERALRRLKKEHGGGEGKVLCYARQGNRRRWCTYFVPPAGQFPPVPRLVIDVPR